MNVWGLVVIISCCFYNEWVQSTTKWRDFYFSLLHFSLNTTNSMQCMHPITKQNQASNRRISAGSRFCFVWVKFTLFVYMGSVVACVFCTAVGPFVGCIFFFAALAAFFLRMPAVTYSKWETDGLFFWEEKIIWEKLVAWWCVYGGVCGWDVGSDVVFVCCWAWGRLLMVARLGGIVNHRKKCNFRVFIIFLSMVSFRCGELHIYIYSLIICSLLICIVYLINVVNSY